MKQNTANPSTKTETDSKPNSKRKKIHSHTMLSSSSSNNHQQNQIPIIPNALINHPPSPLSLQPTNMRLRKSRMAALFIIPFTITFSLYIATHHQQQQTTISTHQPNDILLSTFEHHPTSLRRRVASLSDSSSTAILFPDWEVLIIFTPVTNSDDQFTCVFQNNDTSPAKPAGVSSLSNRSFFKCILPNRVRRLRPFFQPIVTTFQNPTHFPAESPVLHRWSFLAYETLSTEKDVILFAKGVNNRQGNNRPPQTLRCVFSNGVRTAVTSSNQEVFRCRHPDIEEENGTNVTISLEIKTDNNKIVKLPSVAYYTPYKRRSVVRAQEKSLICACTMVYNVAKFLKEWVIYNSNIGVEKFFLYDNGSDDELESVVKELRKRNYQVETILWHWSKTQEAGFSHCATYANDTCKWMIFVDVDEFLYSPSWLNATRPSPHMLKSLLPKSQSVGQIMVKCYEFGPSNQRSHPIDGVIQGYTCRTRTEQRHKSVVLLDAIDSSLLNVIHHFQLKRGYRVKKLSLDNGVVNHYKYQAWSEFKTKFRRRVSAYVVDWTQGMNPRSKDRAPGLGFEPIEPRGWARKFCDVYDYRLKMATRRWFGLSSSSSHDYKMAWQDL